MKNEATAKLESCPIEQLGEMAAMLAMDFRDGAEFALQAVLDALEAKMPEADFVRFCAKLS